MSAISFTGISKMRARLAELAMALRAIASGEVTARAIAKVQTQVSAVAKRITGAHQATGTAAASLTVSTSGSTLTLTSERYLSYHAWWPFRSGMPPFVVTRAVKIFAAEVEAALAGHASPLALAEEAAEERGSAKRAKAAKREERKAAREKRAEDREKKRASRDAKIEDRIRAREERE